MVFLRFIFSGVSLKILIFLSMMGFATNLFQSGYTGKAESIPNEVFENKTFDFLFSQEELDFFDEEITDLLKRRRFNGNVLVARNGTVLYKRSFGYADFRNRTPLSEETPFQLASISKTFTATAVLMLQQDGKLQIDDHVVEHIPEFPYPTITIRQLLNHTSGIQNYMWLGERYWNHRRPPSNEDVLDLFLEYPRPLNFTPGNLFGYSNTGYAFLALLVERTSGDRFPDFVRERIFEPLGMEHSFVYDLHHSQPTRERAYGFRPWRRTFLVIPDVDHDGVMGDKGIYSTINDLYTWDQSIYQNKLLPNEVWQEAFEHARLNSNRPVNYGHGWRLQTFMDRPVVHHPGRWNGFRTSLKRFPEDHATLILLNNNNRNITHLVEELQEILFHKDLQMTVETHQEDPEEYRDGMLSTGVQH